MSRTACAHAAGKNRPMDEDELHFIDAVEQQQREKDRSVREEEAAALDAYQQVEVWAQNHQLFTHTLLLPL